MNELQNGRYARAYVLAGVIDTVNFLVCTILHVTNRKELADSFGAMAAVCFLCILLMEITIAMDIRKGTIREYFLPAIGILGASLAASAQIVLYLQRTIAFNGVILALGLMFLLLVSTGKTIRDVLNGSGGQGAYCRSAAAESGGIFLKAAREGKAVKSHYGYFGG